MQVARFAATLRETYQATGRRKIADLRRRWAPSSLRGWRGLWAGGSLRLACGAVAGLLLGPPLAAVAAHTRRALLGARFLQGPALEYAQLLSHDAARPCGVWGLYGASLPGVALCVLPLWRPLRRQLDLGEDANLIRARCLMWCLCGAAGICWCQDPGRTIVHPRSSKAMFIEPLLDLVQPCPCAAFAFDRSPHTACIDRGREALASVRKIECFLLVSCICLPLECLCCH